VSSKNLHTYSDDSIKYYKNFIEQKLGNIEDDWNFNLRMRQMKSIQDVLVEEFEFDDIRMIETGVSGNIYYGMFGLYFANLVDKYGGEIHSVDIDCSVCKSSEEIIKSEFPNLKYKTYCDDSVHFLKTPPIIPNLIHLDSYDFNLFDPFPSALHTWKEFVSIEKLMPAGSIMIVDDNWRNSTVLQWIENGVSELHEIKYPFIGKGTHLYQESVANRISWKIVGNHYDTYDNMKLILKKNSSE